jgi:ABC-type phosphate transport system substrate-binding protein
VFTSVSVGGEWGVEEQSWGCDVGEVAGGNGAKGNDGVAATVKQVKGAIGYVENAYATKAKLVSTQLKNKSGAFA